MEETGQRVLRLSGEGLCCSQILVAMALEDQGRSNPDLMRAMAGLGMGCGTGQATCGVLTGAACVLGLMVMAGIQEPGPAPVLSSMLTQLHQWFPAAAETPPDKVSCAAVLGPEPTTASLHKCSVLVAAAYDKIMEMMKNYEMLSRGE